MFYKLIKAFWCFLTLLVFAITLKAYEGCQAGDNYVFFDLMMYLLSFPLGALVSFIHFLVFSYTSYSIAIDPFNQFIDWIAFVSIGYFQWFVLLPRLWSTWKARRAARNK